MSPFVFHRLFSLLFNRVERQMRTEVVWCASWRVRRPAVFGRQLMRAEEQHFSCIRQNDSSSFRPLSFLSFRFLFCYNLAFIFLLFFSFFFLIFCSFHSSFNPDLSILILISTGKKKWSCNFTSSKSWPTPRENQMKPEKISIELSTWDLLLIP